MKRFIALILCLMIMLTGCGDVSTVTSSGADAVNAGVGQEPVTVTMFGFISEIHTDILSNLQSAVTAKYPHITLQYESFPTGVAPYTDELMRRIANGKEADIFMTANTALSGSDKLMDLTKEEFVGRYGVSILQEISGDGSVWLLPGIGSVLCYVYNTKYFENPPQTLNELEQMTTDLTKSGKHSFIVPYEQSQPLMIQALTAGYLASPDGQIWLKDYNQGKSTMSGNAQIEASWEMAQRMIDSGVLLEEDMVFAESRRLTRMVEDLGAMSTISSGIASTHIYRDGPSSALTLTPLVGENPENKNVFCAPTCFFAASSHLNEKGNENRRDATLKVLDFISTEEGQNILRGTTPLANSYLRDVEFSMDTQYSQVAEALHAGAYGSVPEFDRGVETVIGEVFGKMLKGEMTASQAIAACDEANRNYTEKPAETKQSKKLGVAAEEFSWTYAESRKQELSITNFVTDSMRDATGTKIALELGTAVRGEFFQGDITDADVESVIRVDKKLYTTQVTGQQMWDIIAQGLETVDSSWFMVVSGLKYSYRLPTKDGVKGELLTLTLEDGTPVKMDETFTVTVSENQMLEFKDLYNFFGSPSQEVPMTLREAVSQNIQRQKEIKPVLDGRITIVQ